MRYLCLIFIILLLNESCGQPSDKQLLQKIVVEWQGNQIFYYKS